MIGKRLREVRQEENITQEKMADMGGVSVRVQQSYEAGRTFPTAQYLARLDRVGIDTHYIITGHRHSVLIEMNEPAPEPLNFALVKNILELFFNEPRLLEVDAETAARAFLVLYRNNLNWNERVSAASLSSVLDVLTANH